MQPERAKKGSESSAKREAVPVDFYARERSIADVEIPPFKSGETVALTGVLEINRKGHLVLDPLYRGGMIPRQRTTFDFGPKESNPALVKLIGGAAKFTVKVNDRDPAGWSHKYNATPSGEPVGETVDDYSIAGLKREAGRYLSIEGRVIGAAEKPDAWDIELRTGKRVPVSTPGQGLKLSSGVHENTAGSLAGPGDVIRLTAIVMDSGELAVTPNIHLVQAAPAREAGYQALRSKIRDEIKAIVTSVAAEDWKASREQIGSFALRDSTDAERKQVYAIIATMPPDQRPIFNEDCRNQNVGTVLTSDYGENVFAKTKAEFLDYARRLATGVIPFAKASDPSYVYRLFDAAGVTVAEQESIYRESIEALKPRVAGVDTRQIRFMDKYMLQQSIGYMDNLPTRSAAEFLLSQLQAEVAAGNFAPKDEKPMAPRRGSIVGVLAGSIARMAADPAGVNNLNRHLEVLKGLEEKLNAIADEPFAELDLNRAQQEILRARAKPAALNEPRFPSGAEFRRRIV